MNRFIVVGLFVSIAALALLTVPEASAQDFRTNTASFIQVDRLGGLGERFHCLSVDPSEHAAAQECLTPDPGARWEVGPGDKVTVEYMWVEQGATPPPTETSVTLSVRIADTTTTVCTLHSGARPANGTTFSFYATDNCLAGGSPRAGALHLRIQVVGGTSPTTNFDCTSDGDETVGTLVGCSNSQRGYVRVPMEATSWTVTSPPSGSTFAFGTAGDESVSTTVTLVRPYQNTSSTFRFDYESTSDALVESSGTFSFGPTDPSETRSSVIDDTYPAGSGTYRVDLFDTSPSQLDFVPEADRPRYVFNTTQPAGIMWVSNHRIQSGFTYTANPNILWDSDASAPADNLVSANFDVYNRAETVSWSGRLLNARDQPLTRSMTIQVRDVGTSTLVDTHVGTGPTYSDSFLLAVTDPAIFENGGAPYRFRASTTDKIHFSLPSFSVSSKYFVDTHTQLDATLVKDDFPPPNENSTEDFTFISGEDLIQTWCHIVNIRQDTDIQTTGAPITIEIHDSGSTLVNSATSNSAADGWTSRVQTAATPPTGEWTATCSISFNGNTGTSVQPIDVISAFTGDKVVRHLVWREHNRPDTIRIWAETEFSDINFPPDDAPSILIGRMEHVADFQFTRVVTADMINNMNHTATVNGSLYYHDFDLATFGDGNYSVVIKVFIDGTPVRESFEFRTQSGNVETMTAFETTSGFGGVELGALVAVAFLSVYVWAQARDLVARVFSGAVPLFVGLLVVFTALEADANQLTHSLGVLLASLGTYLVVRAFYDEAREALS